VRRISSHSTLDPTQTPSLHKPSTWEPAHSTLIYTLCTRHFLIHLSVSPQTVMKSACTYNFNKNIYSFT